MDPKLPRGSMLLAPPPYGGSAVLSFPPPSDQEGRARRAPPVDEHVVKPEVTRDELIRGRKVIAQPALEPHADAHTRLDMLVEAHVRPGYIASTDLLTRVAETSNFATDACVRKEGHDPSTGRRWLEEVAFEIATTQKDRDLREKAEELSARGVRRVFGVFPKRGEVGEWSREKGDFVLLPRDGVIADPVFVRPIAVRALLERAEARKEVVRALVAEGNPEIERLRREAAEATLRGLLLETLAEKLVEISADVRAKIHAKIEGADEATLKAWVKQAMAGAPLP